MKPCLSIACILVLFVCRVNAQMPHRNNGELASHFAPVKTTSSTGFSGTGSNIDVVFQRCNWRLNPDSSVKAIGGSVTTWFKTTAANVSAITFDLNGVFTVSAKYHGNAITVTRPTTNTISLALPVTLPLGQLDSVVVSYNGTPPAASGAAEGFQRTTYSTPADGSGTTQNYIYTLSESYEDRDWWPCKADMQDKIDSLDITVSTPWVGADTFWVATNGKLMSNPIVGNNRIFKFKNRYPMASYLVCVAVARYNRYYRTVNISGTSVPVEYDIFRGKTAATYSAITDSMDKVNQALVAFSAKFGDYPYKNEKHGFYEGLGGAGGMEHQTFSAIASNALTDVPTLSHELMHQWFGDKVSFATWNHLWLAEGFARYSESLVGELVPSTGVDPVAVRSTRKAKTFSSYATTSVVIPDSYIANSDLIWNSAYGGAVYDKGCMVVSMLRKLAGDTKFYQALQNYMSDPALAYKSATTNDLKNHFEAVLNYDLDSFFIDYAYGVGNPAYDVNWGSTGNNVNIELTTQRRSGATVAYYHTPVVLRISNGLTGTSKKDTTVVIYDQNGKLSYAGNGISWARSGKVLSYNLSFAPASIIVDPDHETMVREQDGVTATTNRVASSTVATSKLTRLNYAPISALPIGIIDFKGVKAASGNQLSLLLEATANEINVTAERSEDGAAFTAIGSMTKGTISEKGITYTLEDKTFSNAHIMYYRAKVTDEKGMAKYSKVVALKSMEKAGGISIRPNTVMDNLKIFLSEGWERGPVVATVFNSAGVAVKLEKRTAANSIELPVRDLMPGTYNVEVMQPGGRAASRPFVVVH